MSRDNELPELPDDFPLAPTYLGDSVYCQAGRYLGEWVIYTDNGKPEDPSNVLFLEPQVVKAFKRYIEHGEKLIMDWAKEKNL